MLAKLTRIRAFLKILIKMLFLKAFYARFSAAIGRPRAEYEGQKCPKNRSYPPFLLLEKLCQLTIVGRLHGRQGRATIGVYLARNFRNAGPDWPPSAQRGQDLQVRSAAAVLYDRDVSPQTQDRAVFENVEIPYRGYWSTPFAKWQGPFAGLHSIRFAAEVAKRELAHRHIKPASFDHAVLGVTIPQWRGFWGASWMMSMVGADAIAGPTVAQACQTGPRSLITAAFEVDAGLATHSLVVTCDRMSNGAFVIYPGDGGWGGLPKTESWTVDNFLEVPDHGYPVVQTAENVASRWQITREEQHDVVLMRYGQYQDALANDREFQHRYMSLPFEIPDAKFGNIEATIDGDIGIAQTSRDALDRLAARNVDGTVTPASQTHPADGNAALIVASTDKAREVSADPGLRISVRGFGQARAEPGLMPAAPVPAARMALERAGLGLADINAVKSHNPFVVNDIVFARETGYPVEKMNNFGSSLVFGHPQGPTGTRLIIELIEELVIRGGGCGLYHGCAAGDAGFAVVIEVNDRTRQ